MKRFLSKRPLWVLTVLFFTIVCCFSTQAAEKKKVTATKNMKQVISKVDHYIGDVPKHSLSQWIRIDAVTNSDPDFGVGEEWVYMQSDSIAGSGAHSGYSVIIWENGDKTYSKFEGTHKMTIKEGGVWEVKSEGKYQTAGGTGKFEKIKGGGVYTGTITATGYTGSAEGEVEY